MAGNWRRTSITGRDQIKKAGLGFEPPESLFGLAGLQILDPTAAADRTSYGLSHAGRTTHAADLPHGEVMRCTISTGFDSGHSNPRFSHESRGVDASPYRPSIRGCAR
jgi:hypothetical protein